MGLESYLKYLEGMLASAWISLAFTIPFSSKAVCCLECPIDLLIKERALQPTSPTAPPPPPRSR